MNDTSDKTREVMIAMMKRKSGEERLKMGASMFDTAKQLILASLTGQYSDADRRAVLFQRLYGHDFSPETRARILTHLSRQIIAT